MDGNGDIEREAWWRVLDEWGRQQASIQGAIDSVVADFERYYATIEASMQTAAESILHEINVSQALYAREVLASLQIPQLSQHAALFRNILEPASSMLDEALAPLAQAQLAVANQLQEQMSGWMRDIYAVFEHAFRPLDVLAERIGEKEEIKEAFESAGLWLAPSMPRGLVSRVLELHESSARPGVIASVVSRYYARGNWALLARAVERWRKNPLFERRMPIFQDAFEVHRDGRHTLTVPALVMHVEGICGDYVRRRRLLPKLTGKTKHVVQAALENAPYDLIDVERCAALDGVLTFIERHFYLVRDFEIEYKRLLREKSLTAHAIRHGHQILYGTRMNSLKMFLLLDVLSLLE